MQYVENMAWAGAIRTICRLDLHHGIQLRSKFLPHVHDEQYRQPTQKENTSAHTYTMITENVCKLPWRRFD